MAIALILGIAACAAAPPSRPVPPAPPAAQDQGPPPAALLTDSPETALAYYQQRAGQADAPPATRAEAQGNVGVALIRLGRYPQAVEALEAARQLAPDSATILFNLALAYRHAGDFAKARDSYLAALAHDPKNPDIVFNLGILYEVYLDQPDQAITYYQRYIDRGGPDAAQVEKWVSSLRVRTENP